MVWIKNNLISCIILIFLLVVIGVNTYKTNTEIESSKKERIRKTSLNILLSFAIAIVGPTFLTDFIKEVPVIQKIWPGYKTEQRISDLTFLAEVAKRDKSYRDAEKYYREILDIKPINIATIISLAQMYEDEMYEDDKNKDDFSSKIMELYNQALEYDNDNEYALYYKALFLDKELKDRESAIALYDKLINKYPNNVLYLKKRAEAEYDNGNVTGAIEYITKAIQIEPYNYTLYMKRADYNKTLNEYELAVDDYLSATHLLTKEYFDYGYGEYDAFGAYKDLSNCYVYLLKYDDAIETCTKAINLVKEYQLDETYDHGLQSIYEERANAFWYKGDYSSALMDFDEALKIFPNDSDIIMQKGDIYLERKDYEKALKYYFEVVDIEEKQSMQNYFPKTTDAYLKCARIFKYMNKKDESKVYYDKALESAIEYMDKGSLYLHRFNNLRLAEIYEEIGDNKNAEENYKLALDDIENTAYYRNSIYIEYSRFLNRNDKTYDALKLLEDYFAEIGEAENTDISYLYYLQGLFYSKLNANEEALDSLNKAIENNRYNENYYKFRADIYEKLGDKDMMNKDLEKYNSIVGDE